MGERLKPKISNLDNIEDEIVVMRPLGDGYSKTYNSHWPLIGLILMIVGGSYAWLSNAQKNVEKELALAALKTQEDAKIQEKKQREAFYEGMNQQAFTNQEQEAENARIAWQHYNEAQRQQKVNEILTMEQQVSNGAYIDTRAANQYNQTAKVKSYWKCTDDTGVTTYSVEPCHIETKRPSTSSQFGSVQKEIKLVESQSINVIHNPRPAPRVINNTVVVYRNADNQPSMNKMNSLDCQNAKRAYKFEKGSYFGKSFNKERIINDVWTQCGGWPRDLEG